MAKKKRKPANHKSVQTHFTRMSPTEVLKVKIKQSFKDQIRSAKSNQNIDKILYEALDYDPIRQKRRMEAIIATLDRVKSVTSEIVSEHPEVFTVESEWIDINAYPLPGYDFEERFTSSAFAATVWMLDQLEAAGKMHGIDPAMEIVCEGELPPTPSVWDLCHDTSVMQAMMKAIYLRNDNRKLYSEDRDDELIRIYMSDALADGSLDRSADYSAAYDQVLSHIPQQAIDDAVAHYEQVYWDWIKRYFQSRSVLAQMEIRFYNQLLELEKEAKAALVKPAALLESPLNLSLPLVPIINAAQTIPNFASDFGTRTKHLPLLMDDTKGLEFRKITIEQAQSEILQTVEDLWHLVGFIPQWTYEQTVDEFGEEIADIWKDFDTGDPYEMAFAFMYLLDTGSDLPWCYFPGTNIHTASAAKLPWTRVRFNPLNDGIFYHFDPQDGEIKYGPAEVYLPKRIKVPELEDWYELRYTDRDEGSTDKYNLAQIMYEITGCIMPRKMDRYVPALKTLDKYGISGKRSLHSLFYIMTLLGESKHQTEARLSDIEIVDDEDDGHDKSPSDSIESLQKQIALLKDELKKQKQQAYESSREVRDMRTRYESMAQLAANDAQELHDLRELIFNQQEGRFESTQGSNDISFPYTSSNRIVVFGGHESWAREIKPKLPMVRFVDRETVPNVNMIRNADVIWIQTNALCHPHFYKIVDEAKKNNVPIRYFSYASPTKCAEQLVVEDRKMR